ncbi:MAG: type II secretion system protein [Culicoidibacterales bacterium]
MFKTIKNQKGITLVELLAVMVIVGIIAAISIPAIGNLIENTRKDAYISTGKNLQEAARLVASQNADKCSTTCTVVFAGTVTSPEIDGKANIENIDPEYTTANVVVKNSNGTVTYETTLTGKADSDKTYKLKTAELDVMKWERDNVERANTSAPKPE